MPQRLRHVYQLAGRLAGFLNAVRHWKNMLKTTPIQFPPLESVTRPTVETAAAAFYMNRRPQTMRGWASAETFPDGLRPLRVNGRLAWPVSELRRVLGVA